MQVAAGCAVCAARRHCTGRAARVGVSRAATRRRRSARGSSRRTALAVDLERVDAQRAAAAAVRDERPSSCRASAGAGVRGGSGASSTRVRRIARRHGRATVVDAPGYGGATARTRSWIARRALRPVDAAVLRRAAAEVRARARGRCGSARRGARDERRAARASSTISAATVTLSNTSRAVSSGRIGTACCATMSPASGFAAM